MAGATYTSDADDADKSLQNRQKTLCNGQATGFHCKHYWQMIIPVDVHNAVAIKHGEKSRFCILIDTADGMRMQGEDQKPELPVMCSHYEPCSRRYDPDFEEYNPLTSEEIDAVERQDEEAIKNIKLIEPPRISFLRRCFLHACGLWRRFF